MSLNASEGRWFWFVTAVAALYLLAFQPFQRPTMFDPATWEYMSLSLLDGRVPYRDVFLHKTPGAMFVGAFGAAVAESLGIAPLIGVRVCFIVLGAIAPALVFLLCVRRDGRVAVALAAAAWLLAYQQWSLAALEGARPKVATTALGLACLLFATTRPLISGMLGSASVLCWQPGAVFLAVALGSCFATGRYDDGHARIRVATAIRLTVGAVLPVAALLAYLAHHGALAAFIDQTVGFNLHYIESKARTPFDTITRLGHLSRQWNPVHSALFPLALAGLYRSRRGLPVDLTVATSLYLALTFVSLQAWPDTILFAPGVAALLAVGLVNLVSPRDGGNSMQGLAVASVALLLMSLPGSSRFAPPITLTQQRTFMTGLASDLSATDHVYVVSCPEFLVLTGRHSVLPWPYMWFGVDRFASERTDAGFDGILETLERTDPELMLVCRRWHGALRQRFEQWAQSRYSREDVRFYPHTRRPMAIYRRKAL